MLLKAVRFSVAIEGHKKVSEEIVKEIEQLKQKKMKATLQEN